MMNWNGKFLLAVAVAAGAAGFWLAPVSSDGQTPPPASKTQALVAELLKQQEQLDAQTTATEKRLATLEETMRTARIFAARGGGSGKAPK